MYTHNPYIIVLSYIHKPYICAVYTHTNHTSYTYIHTHTNHTSSAVAAARRICELESVRICVHIYVYMCLYMCLYIHTYIHVYTYKAHIMCGGCRAPHLWTRERTNMCTYIYIYVYIYIYIYMCVFIYTYIYTYIYIQSTHHVRWLPRAAFANSRAYE